MFVHKGDLAKFSSAAEEHLAAMRSAALDIFGERKNLLIGVNGSLARREFTNGSDVDFFVVNFEDSAPGASNGYDEFAVKLSSMGFKMPSQGGVFDRPQLANTLLHPIGGNNDTNELLTKRMLFLLEGEWIFNRDAFFDIQKRIIEKYVPNDLEESKLCLYLLNDIIRYWRTICIDFEHKTSGGAKPRAIRLVKLRFSRMLLSFAGILAIAEAVHLPVFDKRAKLVRLFSIPALSRSTQILGDKFSTAFNYYSEFLVNLDDRNIRTQLEIEGPAGLETPEFRHLNQLARDFKNELLDILLSYYGKDSAIVKSLLL